jgi:hypothetical protein
VACEAKSGRAKVTNPASEVTMPIAVEGFTFDKPPEFRTEEVTIGLVAGLPDSGASPSLIVQSRPARPGATAELVAAEILGELLQSMPGMKNGSKGEITFDDGGTGSVVSYTITSGKGELRQYFVLRVHQGRVCTATLTTPVAHLNDAVAQSMMKCLSSIRPS